MVSWNLFCSFLLFQACLAVYGASKDNALQRRSLSGVRCMHNGVRADTQSGTICLCLTGYTGTSCETVEVKRPGETELSDLNVQNGGVISCMLQQNVCVLHINVCAVNNEAKAKNTIKITTKSHTANSDIRQLAIASTNRVTYQFGQLHILSIPVYIHSVHGKSGNVTFNVLQDNKIVDSVSYKLEFVDEPTTTVPVFSGPGNILSDSRLVCKDFCRFLIMTRPLPNNTCLELDSLCGSAWSFPSFYSGSMCYTEIVFISDSCQKLCFRARNTANILCYWRFPTIDQSASCGCDPLCNNAILEDVCCPQNRTIDVCEVGGLSTAVVTGISVGTSLSALIAFTAVGVFFKFRAKLKNEIDSKADTPGDDGKKKPQNKNDVRRSSGIEK